MADIYFFQFYLFLQFFQFLQIMHQHIDFHDTGEMCTRSRPMVSVLSAEYHLFLPCPRPKTLRFLGLAGIRTLHTFFAVPTPQDASLLGARGHSPYHPITKPFALCKHKRVLRNRMARLIVCPQIVPCRGRSRLLFCSLILADFPARECHLCQ